MPGGRRGFPTSDALGPGNQPGQGIRIENPADRLKAIVKILKERTDFIICLAFMSPEHHSVRNFVVRELPRCGRPISISRIAAALRLPRCRTEQVVDDLEANRFFLVRRNGPEVTR